MRTRNFNCRQSRWNEIEKSSLGNDYVAIKRPITANGLRKGNGQMVTAIDVKRNEIPTNILIMFETGLK